MNNLSDLTKVRPSDPFRFPARVYNDLQDMLTWWRRQKTSFSGGISLAGPGQDGETILVRNDCGADRMNGEVLALNGPIFNHADNPADFEARNWIWSGNQPGSSSAGKFCLLLEPIASAAIGRAAISGTWPANVNTSTAADTNAEISANSYNLQGGSTGSAQILSTEGNPSGLQWCAVRLPLASVNDTVPFVNISGQTIPANGVICCYQTAYPSSCPGFGSGVQTDFPSGGICAAALQYYRGNLMGWAGGYFVNVSGAVAAGANGQCSPATHKPWMALYHPGSGFGVSPTPLAGEIWGPAPGANDFALYRGLPGFMIAGPVNTANNTVGVIQAPGSCTLWCAAKEAWHYGPSLTPRSDQQCWVTCYPLAGGPGAGQYDGSQQSPPITMVVLLRRGQLAKDPNVVAGNVLAYRATTALYPAIAGGGSGTNPCFEPADLTYLDEPVGTIRACAVAMAAPQGWAPMDGTSNATGSGIDAAQNFFRAGTPGTTGGSATHMHSLECSNPNNTCAYGSFTTVPTGMGAASSLPPYVEIGGWLERINNGQS